MKVEEYSILLIDRPQDISKRALIAKILFEKFNLESICFENSATAAAMAHCKESALVIDIGATYSRVDTIHLGNLIPNGNVISFHCGEIWRRRHHKMFSEVI